MGLPITELNVSGGRIRRRCRRTKRVPRRSGFAFGCHAQSIRKRERERDKHNITTQNKIGRKERVRMHEKCMNI